VSTKSLKTHIRRFLQLVGEDPDREGLRGTPDRVLASFPKLFGGYTQDAAGVIKTFPADGYEQVVLVKDIELYSTCEHHLLPFFGKAHVAYIPEEKVIGVSKLARIVEIYSRRLQIQERICQQVTNALMEHLKPVAAACIIEAQHLCMMIRGVEKQHSKMVTSSLEGSFRKDPSARSELMRLIGK
jgi:GTP cyclohydrolase I